MAKTNRQNDVKANEQNPTSMPKDAEQSPVKDKINETSLAVEPKGFSQSDEFRIGRVAPVENNPDSTLVVIRN